MTGRGGKPPPLLHSQQTPLCLSLITSSNNFSLRCVATYLFTSYFAHFVFILHMSTNAYSTYVYSTNTGYTKYTAQVTKTRLLSQLKCDSPFQMMNWWSEKWICFQLVTHRRNNNSVREKVAGWWMVWTAGSQRSNGVSDWVGYVAVR